MKFCKKSVRTSVKMELVTERSSSSRISKNFKRSKSFRASSRFMSRIRNQTNSRNDHNRENDADASTASQLEIVLHNQTKCENSNLKNMELMEKIFSSHNETKDITDLRGIVQDVKNKLSISMTRHRRNKYRQESTSTMNNDCSCSLKKISEAKDSTKKRHEVAYVHSYENPTFDCSFDNSISGCLYKNDPADWDEHENVEFEGENYLSDYGRNNETDGDEKKLVTIVVGDDRRFVESRINETTTTTKAPPEVMTKKSNDNEIKSSSMRINRESFANNESIDNEKFNLMKNTNNSASWLVSRGSSFRFRATNGCKTESTGLLTGSATNVSKFHTFQGMEFLEGFGKKKHHQASTNLPTNINPLTAQPSLNIHVHALFSAVEHGHLDKARSILESTDVDVNSVNSDGLSALDVAVLGNNRSLAKMLVAFGAQEGNRFTSPECLGGHLSSLLLAAEQRVQDLGGTASGNLINETGSCRNDFTSHNGLARCNDISDDKQLALWERRVRALRKMLLGFDQARPPDTPLSVAVDVTGTTSIVLKFQESEIHESSICTKFKVQWSNSEDFTNICGERQVMDMKQRDCRIDRLVQGQRYHLRIAAGNIKGWSRFAPSTPAYVIPSSWRDLEGKQPRYFDCLDQLDAIFSSLGRTEYSKATPALQRRNHKKKTTSIKQLFSATCKFQKSLRRGIFLACLLYHEDKILVTNEDFLPVIEIDETYSPSCVYNDFHWFTKVSCIWDDVKVLRQDMEKRHAGSSNHLRMKIMQATSQMQAALSIQDLGQIYHKPLRDASGTMVVSIVNSIKNPKSISLLNGRWLPIGKIIKKTICQDTSSNVADILINSIHSQITYHRLSGIKLTRGLYLGYLKMRSSVDLVHILVQAKAPNVLPHCKIRDNPHVSADEWDYLKRTTKISSCEISSRGKLEEMENVTNEGTEQQKLFVELVSSTSRRLLSHMNVNIDDSQNHRIYDSEVIELANNVTLIAIVPPADVACAAPGSRELYHQRDDLLSLPVQIFEILHLSTYQKKIMNLYSRLSCILELDMAQAKHNYREAFSSSEVSAAKDRLAKLQELQCRTNAVWKSSRWLVELITFARDRGNQSGQASSRDFTSSGISMKNLLDLGKIKNNNNNNGSNVVNGHSLKRSLLQLPPRDPKLVKSSPGRGSWPGPNLSAVASNSLTGELSKSEQQLPNGGANGQYTRKIGIDPPIFVDESNNSARYKTDTSNTELGDATALSKFEDSIQPAKYKHSPRNRTVNSLSLIAVNASPSAGMKNFVKNFHAAAATTNGSMTHENTSSLSNSEDYGYVNTSFGHGKTKIVKPTASVAAVAAPSMDCQLDRKKDESSAMPAPLPGILQVYAAYETGLASGTSLKLHVTPRTTAREVVDLVVKQLNMAVVLKGQEGPIYTSDELPNFCLVAVIGARERCLRDDFKPLQLQNPWKKGRLYVRQKQDVLAALEHSSKHTAYL